MEPWKITLRERGDFVIADMTMGGQRFRSRVNVRQMFNRVMARYRVRGVPVGWSLKSAWKKIKKTAKKVVKNKVWKVAEKVTALGSALPPPYGPALAATSASMKSTRALVLARKAAKRGDKKTAKRLVKAAGALARKHGGGGKSLRAAKPLYLALV